MFDLSVDGTDERIKVYLHIKGYDPKDADSGIGCSVTVVKVVDHNNNTSVCTIS